jgi:hypothetical protein
MFAADGGLLSHDQGSRRGGGAIPPGAARFHTGGMTRTGARVLRLAAMQSNREGTWPRVRLRAIADNSA